MAEMRDPRPGAHMYVDESTSRQYLVVCAVIGAAEIAEARQTMRSLLLPGQRGGDHRKFVRPFVREIRL